MSARVVVLGAGTMGSGIAALLASHGHPVTLLDLPSAQSRNERAEQAIARQLERGGFKDPAAASLVTAGNLEDDLAAVAQADWVIEAVVENLAIKQDLYQRVAQHLASHALLTSNTSTIVLEQLGAQLDDDLASRFGITHFFNPPRAMKLVELVTSPRTNPATSQRLRKTCSELDKTVIECKDSPGFIANRIGNFWMAAAYFAARDHGVDIELADEIMGKPFGIPRTGVFGLFDYVGIHIIPAVWGSLEDALPPEDDFHRVSLARDEVITTMIERGITGFYRNKGQEVLDVTDFSYRPRRQASDPARDAESALAIMRTDSPAGRFARETFLATLSYASTHAESIAHSLSDIDAAMRLGYGWRRGPFELAEEIGLAEVIELADASADLPPLLKNAAATGRFST